jgi:signal transduction histidine kinase
VEVDTGVVGPIRGLFGELQQVIANLVSNAADAVEPGGKINIAVRPAEVEHEQGVIVSVADDGRGVPPENRDEIFEPFFTTKKDVGTGLGLWVSREIAVRHGGTLTLASSGDGRSGAVFTLFLPYPTDVNFAETAGAGEN